MLSIIHLSISNDLIRMSVIVKIIYVSLACIGSYLLGSIPTSVWLGRLLKGKDVREHHTRNPGGMNAVRTFGLTFGTIVLFIDCFKGTLTIALIDQLFSLDYFVTSDGSNIIHTILCIIGPALALLGHIYPFWLKFDGGQGLGVFMGTLMYVNPLVLWAYFFGFIFLSLVFKMPLRRVATIVVLFCIPVALFMPLAPPWSNILLDMAFGPYNFFHLTQGLIIASMDLALLSRLIENILKGSAQGKKTGTEIG